MIRALERRFVLIAMLALTVTLGLLITGINVAYIWRSNEQADFMLDLLYHYNGELPHAGDADDAFPITAETRFETRFFIAKLNEDEIIVSTDFEHIATLDEENAADCIARILEKGTDRGRIDRYQYQIVSHEDRSCTVLVLDWYQQLMAIRTILRITLAAAGICWVTVLFLLLLFSKQAVRPFAENLQRQKQFITDASHELKTPLTVISANAEVLSITEGDNEWLSSIRNQTTRMNELISSMIELACTEEAVEIEHRQLNLSNLVEETLTPFETVLQAQGKQLKTTVTPELTVYGAEEGLQRLISVLMDNAVKYTPPGGTVTVSLCRQGKNVMLTVRNPCPGMDESRLPYLFDRFYRTDESRSRQTGGSGIGLSIAQAIVQQHRGKISVRLEDGGIVFTVLL